MDLRVKLLQWKTPDLAVPASELLQSREAADSASVAVTLPAPEKGLVPAGGSDITGARPECNVQAECYCWPAACGALLSISWPSTVAMLKMLAVP